MLKILQFRQGNEKLSSVTIDNNEATMCCLIVKWEELLSSAEMKKNEEENMFTRMSKVSFLWSICGTGK